MAARPTLVVGQSGGPTAVINCSLAGVLDEASDLAGDIGDIVGLRFGIEGLLGWDFVDLRRDAVFAKDLRETPSSVLGSCRHRLADDGVGRALEGLRRLDARYFVYIGGNDSADTSHRIAVAAGELGMDLRCIGVPKTVDNDLPETDHCPGYGSAARFLATTTMEVSRDTEAMRRTDPIKIVEIAGRHAGWLAAASALGRRAEEEGPHLVYVPESPVSVDAVLGDVDRAYGRHGHVVLALSENQPDESGAVLGADGQPDFVDAFGHPYFASPAAHLAREIRGRLGVRAKWEKPGTLQRMSMGYRSGTDAEEAYLAGREAVRLALRGETDRMVVLRRTEGEAYGVEFGSVPLEMIANRQRTMPPEFVSRAGAWPTEAFRRYAMPLVGELPRHVRL